MNVFHRHLLLRHLRMCGIALSVLFAVSLVQGAPGMLEAVDGGSSSLLRGAGTVARAWCVAFGTVLPLALLLGTLFTVGDLARYQELTALEAAGWSRLRILSPLLLVAILATLLLASMQLADLVAPPGTHGPQSHGARAAEAPIAAAALTELHARLAHPLLGFLSVAVAIPLASTRRRVTVYSNFGMAMLVLLMYYIATATLHALGRHGGLPPALAGWLGPALLGAATLLLWLRPRR
ncbi:MAG: LptF/LptG family permease [bacterium]|nr:LptF/LptG family permease [bacterium]